MGYLSNEHIKQFCWGKKVKEIQCDSPFGLAFIKFTDDTYLQLDVSIGKRKKKCGCMVDIGIAYATPYEKNTETGLYEVKQSLDIMREIQP